MFTLTAAWLLALSGAALATPSDQFDDPDPRRRIQAYRSLVEVGPDEKDATESLEIIANSLAGEQEPHVRAAGRDAMARLPLEEEELIQELTEEASNHALLEDGDIDAKIAASIQIQKIWRGFYVCWRRRSIHERILERRRRRRRVVG